MKNIFENFIRVCLTLMLFGGMVSCVDQLDDPTGHDGQGGLVFRAAGMLEVYRGPDNYATRAGAIKEEEEKEIKTLHIFFFGSDGKLLTSTNYDNFKAYQKLAGAWSIKIPTGEGVDKIFEEGDTNVTIVAIANIDATDDARSAEDAENSFYTEYSRHGKIQKEGRDAGGTPYEITCYDDLKTWVYYPRIRMTEDGRGDISSLPDAGMPMIGEMRGVDLSTKQAETQVVNLTAMMAKVNVSVSLEPDMYTDEYPTLTIKEYGVRNMPIAVPFEKPDGQPKEGKNWQKPDSYADYFENYNVTAVPMFHKGDAPSDPTHFVCDDAAHEVTVDLGAGITINKNSDPVLFSYYTFENINLPDYNAVRTNGSPVFNGNLEPQYPDGVTAENYQRWKSTFAYSDRASALILKGEYRTHQGMRYQAQFTVYMGSDSDIDFQVKRNHCYDNNIVIHGLEYIRNSDDEAYTFDGRVNVVSDNPFYLSIVNERKVDAHATALPMDVWFMLREDGNGGLVDASWNSEITFTVRDHDNGVDWIRMEKVPRATMEAGNFRFGTGARDYFTTDLVTNTLRNNHTITVDGDDDGSRSRIYFYIDENVPTSNNPTNYGKRTAYIDIEYTRTDESGNVVDRRTRTLDIEQQALVKVSGTWQGNPNNNGTRPTATIPDTWMEYYEEYLEHSDPLDKHESPGELYEGLPWGLSGVNIYYSALTTSGFNNPESGGSYQVYYKTGAFKMTQWAFARNNTIPNRLDVRSIKLFNTEVPASAFHYCYGKNKRDSEGYVVTSSSKGWYMPGIRELEKGLVDYYNTFSDFRGNLYWSASGSDESRWSDGTHARATKVTLTGSTPTYVESRDGGEGYNLRTKVNRIRAFYRVD